MSAQGMAETVAWTALHNATVQDGLSPPVQPGPQVTKAIRELVSEAPTAAQPGAGSGWDALETALEIFKRRKSDIPYVVYEQIEVICSLIAARQPVPMVLHCPRCHLQHIDAPDERTPEWHNPPHRSHLCHGCGFVWRPADVPTVGVERTQTTGKNDSPPAPCPTIRSTHPQPAAAKQ